MNTVIAVATLAGVAVTLIALGIGIAQLRHTKKATEEVLAYAEKATSDQGKQVATVVHRVSDEALKIIEDDDIDNNVKVRQLRVWHSVAAHLTSLVDTDNDLSQVLAEALQIVSARLTASEDEPGGQLSFDQSMRQVLKVSLSIDSWTATEAFPRQETS